MPRRDKSVAVGNSDQSDVWNFFNLTIRLGLGNTACWSAKPEQLMLPRGLWLRNIDDAGTLDLRKHPTARQNEVGVLSKAVTPR